MATRQTYDGSEIVAPTGVEYAENVAGHVGRLYNSIALRPVTITNSGNDYTITIDPVLDGDVISPMSFFINPNVDNTNPVRIRVTSSNPYYDLVRADGSAFAAAQFRADTEYFIAFLGGKFVALSDDNQNATTSDPTQFVVTASGTVDLTAYKQNSPAGRMVLLEAIGGGGGGGEFCGGGGGAHAFRFVLLADLPDVLSVSIGAGGSGNASGVGTVGGNTTIGSFLTAYGGGPSGSDVTGGGGGGGALSAGGSPTGGSIGGGNGAVGSTSVAEDAKTECGGGGGGNSLSGYRNGGRAYKGGGGGGGDSTGVGGASTFAGSGGNGRTAGAAPGGGGGARAAGGRGEAKISIL